MAWRQTEEHLAQGVAHTYLKHALPHGAVFSAIDHAGKSSVQAWQRMLKRGVKPGVADWYILWQGRTLWAEQKTPTGPIGDNQVIFAEQVTANGASHGFFVDLTELHALLVGAGIPASPPRHIDLEHMLATRRPAVASPKKRKTSKPRTLKPSRQQIARIEGLRQKIMF